MNHIKTSLAQGQSDIELPSSKFISQIASVLENAGYLAKAVSGPAITNQARLKITLKNAPKKIHLLKRHSKPGRRIFVKANEIPRPLSGHGLVVISTPGGVMTGDRARRLGLGGELIATIY